MEDYIVIYAVVPKYIYETKELTPEEKLIAERIIFLCKKEGYCWITNKKLAEIYNIKIETVSRHIKKLESIGLIKCIYTHNDKHTRRLIHLVNNIWDKWSNEYKSNNQNDNDYTVKHNNKYNYKKEYKNNIPSWMEHPEMCTSTPCDQEEIDDFNSFIEEFRKWKKD